MRHDLPRPSRFGSGRKLHLVGQEKEEHGRQRKDTRSAASYVIGRNSAPLQAAPHRSVAVKQRMMMLVRNLSV